jgi:putative CocE/NonD family hydrolase
MTEKCLISRVKVRFLATSSTAATGKMRRRSAGSLAVLGPLMFALACRHGQTHADVAPFVAGSSAEAAHQGASASAKVEPKSTDAGTAPLVGEAWVAAHYEKFQARIPMRDGTRLHTMIYRPRGHREALPILLHRTPYSVGPYEENAYPKVLGPSEAMMRDGYIFVYQDVRGTFMSEGKFENMRPHIDEKRGRGQFDESSDTYDTVEWLVSNVAGNNGKVGMWGISYPGFYAAAGMIDAHPNLVAVSPQAPIADWYFDDFHHHGAFFLPHAFGFLSSFGFDRPEPTTKWHDRMNFGTQDGYNFYLKLGALPHANDRYLHYAIGFWDDLVAHPNYDDFWQQRSILPHLHRSAPAVMTVGGWFDAEDLYGPLNIYRALEEKNPNVFNMLVMGPWRHGGWARDEGDHLGNIEFGGKQSLYYQAEIEAKFFGHHLKGREPHNLPEAMVFETGRNRWRQFETWPPANVIETSWFSHVDGSLRSEEAPREKSGFAEFLSDPAHPVPFTQDIALGMTREYMTDDQRFAARRPDVVSFQSPPMPAATTFAGPILAELWVSTDAADADWIVKVIDVFPDDASDHPHVAKGQHMGGYQMMVRSEVIRGRFRDGYETPKPFRKNAPTLVRLPLQDVLHTFEPGHRLMIQVQSTWFPLVDRNPQRWVDNIFEAKDQDYTAAHHRVYSDSRHPTRIRVGVLPATP